MRIAQLDGVSLEYEVEGDGEPLVLIHLAPYADSFLPLMAQPSLADYQLIRYHRRGYAGSSRTSGRVSIPENAADLAGLLQFLGIKRAHVAGHSYGGLVALQLALDHPELVASLLLMEPALRVKAGSATSEELTRRMSLGFQRYRDGDREGAVEGFLGATFGPGYRQQLEQVLPGWWAQAVRDADAFFGAELPELQGWGFGQAEAQQISAPVLSIRGALSDPAFVDFEQLLREWFPRLETAEIPGVDHRLHLQRADAVAAAVAEFLSRHRLSAATASGS